MAKKYYWLKLKDNFFGAKEIKKLRNIAGGDTYTVIYLKMMLLSLQDEGRLFYDGIEETFAEELALELDEDAENVKITVMYLQKMGLLEEISATEAFLTQVPESVGKETEWAEKKRLYREKVAGQLVDNKRTLSAPCPTEKEIDKEKDKDIEIDKEKRRIKRFSPPSVEEVTAYVDEKQYNVDPESFIAFYESNGWKVGKNPMKDWKAAVRTWHGRHKEETKTPKQLQDEFWASL